MAFTICRLRIQCLGMLVYVALMSLMFFSDEQHEHACPNNTFCYRAAAMQTRSSNSMSVCLSVCPSVCPSNACIVTKQTKVLLTFLYHMKGIEVHLVFWHEEWLVGTSPSTWNFRVKLTRSLKNGDFQSIFARSAAAFRPSERSSIITNRKSTTSFPMSLRWTEYVAPNLPPKGAQKRKLNIFFL